MRNRSTLPLRALALSLTLLGAPALAGAASPILAGPCAFQDDPDEKPDKRPEIKEMLGELKEFASERGAQDREAIGVLDKLLQEFPESGPKDRKEIVDGISKCLKQKRKDNDDGTPDNRLYLASAVCLGHMGPESVKPLEGWIGHKQHRKDLALQRQLILSLGKTADEDAIDTLVDLLTHKDAIVQGAAAEALGVFETLELKKRKEVFEDVLKVLNAVYDAVRADALDRIAKERYDVIAAPMITTLQKLSGQDLRDPNEWRSWWNNNKKKDWDDL